MDNTTIKDLENLKNQMSEYEMVFYDNILILSEQKIKLVDLKRFSVKNIYNFWNDNSAVIEKDLRHKYNSEKKLYDEGRFYYDELKEEIYLKKYIINSGQIDETSEAENIDLSYKQKIFKLRGRISELTEIINIGKRLIAILNELLVKTNKADSYYRFKYASERNLKENLSRGNILSTLFYGESDKNKIIDKIYFIVKNVSNLMKSFILKLYNINKNQLIFIKTGKLKYTDISEISITFIDYFYSITVNDMKKQKDLTKYCVILDGLCEKINKIIGEIWNIKSPMEKELERLYQISTKNN